VAGEMAVTDGHFRTYFDVLGALKGSEKPKSALGFQLFSIREPPFSNTGFDVRITSKHPFKVHNNLIKGAVRPDLRLSGSGEVPILTGTVYVDSTRLALPAGNVLFESGAIRFDKTRPDLPSLDLIGKSRMAGYDITVSVEGPYNAPVVTLSSVPPLSSEDLLLLVLTGRVPESTEGFTPSQRQQINVAVYLGRDLLARWFSRKMGETDESVFDRFELDVGRAMTREGEDTIDAQFRLAEGVFRDGATLYITAEKDVFDFYNAGMKIVFRFK
jgi:translocation and assembly module TamB